MRVVQINAIYGSKSTGTIVKEIQSACVNHGIESYVAYSIADRNYRNTVNGYRIGNFMTAKWHAFFSRVIGKQAYLNRISTLFFLKWLDTINPDVVHLHNLHSNYIHLNMLLHYLAKRDIATVITMHDCWYYTGGCTHYSSVGCQRWKDVCGECPLLSKIPSWIFDSTKRVLKDRSKYLNAIPRLTIVGASAWIAGEAKRSVIKGNDICYIHNGFDLSVFRPKVSAKRAALGINNMYVILGPANKWLLPINKPTLDYFLSQMNDNCILVLFGASRKDIIINSRILTIGYIESREEMVELYSMADVFVNCSREDTLSSLNLESQACGTPVVTYDATGSKETVDGISGYTVPSGNYEELWHKAMTICETGKSLYSSECRRWIQTFFDKNKNYDRYISLYNSITQ